MEQCVENEMIFCPYDCHHYLLKSRLPIHLLRCSKIHTETKMSTCPYDTSHFVKEEDFEEHVIKCKAGERHRLRKNMEPITPAPPHPPLEDTVDWDQEPPIETYDPESYCKNNFIIRNIQGEPRSGRRKFREGERLRLQLLADNREEK